MMHSVFHGLAPLYISNIVTPFTHLPGRAHLRSAKKMEIKTLHVHILVLVSVRSRYLDPTPGTAFLGSLEALLSPPRLNVT